MSAPWHEDDSATIWHGDCLELLDEMPAESVDAIVTDPPYGLGFMGKAWDDLPPGLDWAVECLRVLKPGGHLLAFGGTRTWHRLAVAVEDAGFEVRDSIAWLYGSGFPKSLDVSKAIDKLDAAEERRRRALEFTAFIRESGLSPDLINEVTGTNMGSHYTTAASQPAIATPEHFDKLLPYLLGVPPRIVDLVYGERAVESGNFKAREVVGERTTGIGTGRGSVSYIADSDNRDVTAPHTPAAQQWQGWGTALKPAFEPIVVARKPLGAGTVAANVLAHGTGALNVDGCRINPGTPVAGGGGYAAHKVEQTEGWDRPYVNGVGKTEGHTAGRWPTNVVLDGDAAAELDEQSGHLHGSGNKSDTGAGHDGDYDASGYHVSYAGRAHRDYGKAGGGASRFFPVFDEERDGTRHLPADRLRGVGGESSTPSCGGDAGGGRVLRPEVCDGGPSAGSEAQAVDLPVFRYQAKAPTRERVSYIKEGADGSVSGSPAKSGRRCNVCGNQTVPPGGKPWPACGHDDWERFETQNRTANKVAHPTVKPLALMRWLVRLVTPPGGVVLDPFAGSGTTVEAAILEGFQVIGIEREADYLPLIQARIARNQTTSEGLPTVAEALSLFDFEEPA